MIIIETPAPPTRERLVLAPLTIRGDVLRDATPEDLARAGWVRAEQPAPGTLAHLRADLRDAIARAEKAERERDEVRAELARLTAPSEGEPSDDALRDAFEVAYRDARAWSSAIRGVYRLGVAHERARFAAAGVTVARPEDAALFEVVPDEDRATDEELFRAYDAGVISASGGTGEPSAGHLCGAERAGTRAVAARVRQERCHARGEGAECDAADVPATLARLLGEVER